MAVHYRLINKYKYKLEKEARYQLGLKGFTAITEYLVLQPNGILILRKGYAWNGASGPSIDTKNTMQATLIHDALYQLIRLKLLPYEHRKSADKIFYKVLLADGMSKARAWLWYTSVRTLAFRAAKPGREIFPKKVFTAPK